MKNLLSLVLGGAALMGVSMMGPAKADPDYTFAATGFVGGGGSWLRFDNCQGPQCDADIATIVGGGDFVIPLNGYWNVQLSGAVKVDHLHFFFGGSNSPTQAQGGAIGFWRDPAMGVFGIEAGAFSPFGDNRGGFQNSFKIGGVAEYFFSDMFTIGGFGGVLVPMDSRPFGPGSTIKVENGYYAGGHLTYYASDNLALAGFARFTELNQSIDGQVNSISFSQRFINVGGKVRYLTSMPGVELYASGSYLKCEVETSSTIFQDGAQVMGGVNIPLGGHTDSLAAIDRSNAIDTRAWTCARAAIE